MASLNGTNSTHPAHNHKPDQLELSYIGLMIQSCIVIALNITELYLIRRQWTSKKITRFEIILMNLAIADLLVAVGMFPTSIYGMASSDTKQNIVLSLIIVVVLTLGVVSSIFYVLLIGVERLLAIKVPFKMRQWQSHKGRVTKFMILTWVINISITIIVSTLDEVFRKKSGPQSLFGSKIVTYIMSGYVLVSTTAIIFVYTWISYLVLVRHKKFDKSANSGERVSKVKLFKMAIRRERATLTICLLVQLSFVSCNLPIAIRFLLGAKEGNPEVFLVMANSSLNPLIYFFKGYLEKEYASRKAAINSNSGQGVELKSPNLIRKQTVETELDANEKKDDGKLENGTWNREHGERNRGHGEMKTNGDIELESNLLRKQATEKLDANEREGDGKVEDGDYRKRSRNSGGPRTGEYNETELKDFAGQDREIVTQHKRTDSNSRKETELETKKIGARGEDSPQSESSLLEKSFQFPNKWLLENRNSESALSSFMMDREENVVPECSGQSQKQREARSSNYEDVEEGSMEDNIAENVHEESLIQEIVVQEIGIENEAVEIDEPESIDTDEPEFIRAMVVAYL